MIKVQVTIQIWCYCGRQLEVSVHGFAACSQPECPDVMKLPENFQQTNKQITPEQVVAIAEQIEMIHQAGKADKKEDEEPRCYIGCTCRACWADEPAPSWE